MFVFSVALCHRDGEYVGTAANVVAATEEEAATTAVARFIGDRAELADRYVPKIVDKQPHSVAAGLVAAQVESSVA